MTWDHVFPAAWYPDTTSKNLEKWKIPSCHPCNARHGRSESELLLRLGLCIDPDDSKNAGIVEKTLRALDPTAARDTRDRAARASERNRILQQVFTGDQIPLEAVLPQFGPRENELPDDRVAVPVKRRSLEMLTEKIVRGITYLEDSRFIERTHEIQLYVLSDEGAAPIKEMLRRFGVLYERGPGITVVRAVAPEDGLSSLNEITIWGRLRTYAIVSDQSGSQRTIKPA